MTGQAVMYGDVQVTQVSADFFEVLPPDGEWKYVWWQDDNEIGGWYITDPDGAIYAWYPGQMGAEMALNFIIDAYEDY